MTRNYRQCCRRRGAAAVEFALVLPFLLALMLGIWELGRMVEVQQILSTVMRVQGLAIQPAIAPNKNANSITLRGTANVVSILEKVIEQNDKPRAEVVIDVEILEVDRSRAKQYGLNLSEYQLGTIFSPEVAPGGTTTTGGNPINALRITTTRWSDGSVALTRGRAGAVDNKNALRRHAGPSSCARTWTRARSS